MHYCVFMFNYTSSMPMHCTVVLTAPGHYESVIVVASGCCQIVVVVGVVVKLLSLQPGLLVKVFLLRPCNHYENIVIAAL